MVDCIESGSGPVVMLVLPAVSGARQWGRLMTALQDGYHVIAVNLFGYGATPPWRENRPQTLDDHAGLVEAAVPDGATNIALVGHSIGGAIAMKVAQRQGARVRSLVLIEPNPFYLLKIHGRDEAFAESMELRNCVRESGATGDWSVAAEYFADYWVGPGHWAGMPEDRRKSFIQGLRQNFHEWDAVMDETTSLEEWRDSLPEQTLVLSARGTPRTISEIVELLAQTCPHWRYEEMAEGGHMAPLTRPDLVNPVVRAFLDEIPR